MASLKSIEVAKEVGKISAEKSMDTQTSRVINYLLDMLEVKDRNELFAMPDNFQTYDYEESTKQPSNFAIIRQKHRDGMYQTMEAFENDILMLFAKAIESSDPNSSSCHEAMSLRKDAKKVFQSLKNNPIHAEFELSQWHQDYFKHNKSRIQSNIGTSSNAHGSSSHINVTSEPEMEAKQCRRTRTRGRPRTRTCGRPRTRIAIPKEDEIPQFLVEQRRNSYITMFAQEPKILVYNNDSGSYLESLQRFASSAGPVAKDFADRKCNEYSRRMRAQTTYKPSPIGNPSTISTHPPYTEKLSSTSVSKNYESSIAYGEFEFKSCELHTDELLNQFCLIGNSGSGSKQEIKPELKLNTYLRGSSSNSTKINMLPHLNLTSEMKNPPPSNEMLWQPKLSNSKP